MESTALSPGLSAHPLWTHQLELLLESTGEGVFGIDLDGHCTFINRAGARMLGWDAAQVLGKNMHELTHHSHADGRAYPTHECPIFNAFRQGLPCRIDVEVFWRQDGSAFPVEYSSHPLMDQGVVKGAVVTFVDITERRKAAQALQKAHDDLARANDELELRVSQRTSELSTALDQLRELSAYSESVREEERTRIAREVHDELGSLLVALKMDINWMDKRLQEESSRSHEEAQAMRTRLQCKCRDMSHLIENAVVNVGRIITDLRPSILDHQGLWAALEWQAQTFADAAELSLLWQMRDAPALELPEPMAIAIFRIFQEMLSNVGRHAQASMLDIQMDVQDQALVLSVRDNGCGANPMAFESDTAYGIMGMRERARHFGGSIQIDSHPGQGSTFRLIMPIREAGA